MPEQPNIVLITTDQQRFDAAGGGHGPSWLRTPHLDDLRCQGITFDAAYADCPICVASRMTIMTGKPAWSHGNVGNGKSSNYIGRENTLPTLLREAGYQTAAIGKMHWGPQRCRHGFEEMLIPEDYYRQMVRRGIDVMPMRHGLGQNELHPGMATVPEALTLTSWIAEQCVDYIRERRDPTVPFFLWCSFPKPHPPLDPPEPYYSMYLQSDIPAPVVSDWCDDEQIPAPMKRHRQRWSQDRIDPEILRAARAAYYGLITQNDYNMGRVFAALQDLGMLQETLILFCSDHGEYLGDHNTGAKSFFHESSAHVPFVLKLPKSWENRGHGTVVASPISLADILPTFVTAAGGRIPADVEGRDLVAIARGEAPAHEYAEGFTYANSGHQGVPASMALTDGRWKYLWWPEGPTEQLFDLDADPQETHNLAAERPDKCDELHAELVRRHEARGDGCVEDGRLISREVALEDERELRSQSRPGYHTEYYDVDVRH